jgi:hypothetical protein
VEPPIMPIGIFTPTDQLAQASTPDEEKKAGAERAGEGRQHEFLFLVIQECPVLRYT